MVTNVREKLGKGLATSASPGVTPLAGFESTADSLQVNPLDRRAN
jgi:hypothetical protein